MLLDTSFVASVTKQPHSHFKSCYQFGRLHIRSCAWVWIKTELWATVVSSRKGLIPIPPRLSHGGVTVPSQGLIPPIPSKALTQEPVLSCLAQRASLSRNTAALLQKPSDLLAPTHPPGPANLSLMLQICPCLLGWVLRTHHLLLCKVQPNRKITDELLVRAATSASPGDGHVSASGTTLSSPPSSVLRAEQMLREYLSSERICHQSSRMERPTRNSGTHL